MMRMLSFSPCTSKQLISPFLKRECIISLSQLRWINSNLNVRQHVTPEQSISDQMANPIQTPPSLITSHSSTNNTNHELRDCRPKSSAHLLSLFHPQGIAPPPLSDIYLDGPPPVCGRDKFQWQIDGKEWTYRFTVVENKKRVDLMPNGNSHTIAFFPSISPTSSREEMRQCARIMANKGHQCLLIEFPGYHTDQHINNRIQPKVEPDEDGIYHLKDDLSLGIDAIRKPLDVLLPNKKPTTNLYTIGLKFAARRLQRLWTGAEHQHSNSSLLSSTQPLLAARMSDNDSNDQKMEKLNCPDNNGPHDSSENDDVPFTHIFRSFCRQYIRFLLVQWGATPLSVVTHGQSAGFFLKAIEDLICLGKAGANIEVESVACQLANDWQYNGDGHPLHQTKKNDVRIHLGHGRYVSYGEACEIVRDSIVADLIRMNVNTVVFASPFWKSTSRNYFEDYGCSNDFTPGVRQYLLAKYIEIFKRATAFTDYCKQRRLQAESIYRFLIPRFERPITEFNIYKHRQASFRGIPISMHGAWLGGWLEPVKSDQEFEDLFVRLCVSESQQEKYSSITPPSKESRAESYRIPATLVMVGRSCIDKDFDEFNLFAKHCIRLDSIWRRTHNNANKSSHQDNETTRTNNYNTGTHEDNKSAAPKSSTNEVSNELMVTSSSQFIKQMTAVPKPFKETFFRRHQKQQIDFIPIESIEKNEDLSSFHGIPLPATYGEVDDWNYHRDYDKKLYYRKIYYRYYYIVDCLIRPFFPDLTFKRQLMLKKLHQGKSPKVNGQPENNSPQEEWPFAPRCLPVKGALQCIEEYPKFSAECLDQFIHKRDIDFEEIEKYWIPNPLYTETEEEGISETEIG